MYFSSYFHVNIHQISGGTGSHPVTFKMKDGELEKTRITTGGDQLTRTHLDSAKNLRLGTHSVTERLLPLSPVVEELFHVQQDLLEKIYKKYYDTHTARIPGTLSNFRAVLRRTNVNGMVKSTNSYQPHKDFACTVARSMIVNISKETVQNFGHGQPEKFRYWRNDQKWRWIKSYIKPIIDRLYIPYSKPNRETVSAVVRIGERDYRLVVPPEMQGKTVKMSINGVLHNVEIPSYDKEKGETGSDNIQRYSLSFIRAMLDFMLLDMVIKAGDIDRLTISLKRLIPTFIGLHSFRSKYAIELINLLTKTEFMLSEKDSVKCKLQALVNTQGKSNHNKPADMQQENNIKSMKTVLKGLGATKSEKAIVRASKAATGISSIVEAFRKSLNLTLNQPFDHHKKHSNDDENIVAEILEQVRPFALIPIDRTNMQQPFCGSCIHTVDKFMLSEFILRNAKRAVNRHETVYFDENLFIDV